MRTGIKKIGFFFVAFSLMAFAAIETRQQFLQQQLDLFNEFYVLMDKHFVDTINLPQMMKKSINKTVAELDDYSSFHDPEEVKKWNDNWKGILWAGIGTNVKQSDSGVVIEYPYKDMPAMNAGLRTGDLIIEINSRNVKKLQLDSVVKLLRGNEGDSIYLTIQRPYLNEIKHFGIKKENIIESSVPLWFMLNDHIGYIKLSLFKRGTSKIFIDALNSLKLKGMKKLVLDLRANNGGLVEECTSSLSALLPKNTLVCNIISKDTANNYTYRTLDNPIDTLMPIVMLTDKHTISSGEIFAGCLKDTKRAVLIGEKTYGKGFVQSTFYLKNGSILYVTTGKYYTPSGYYVGKKGVEPNVTISTKDSLDDHLKAIINSGIIANYCIKHRNTKHKKAPEKTIGAHFKDFKSFYYSQINYIKFPEEEFIGRFKNYQSVKQLKANIMTTKRTLPDIYRHQIEVELKKELLKQNYDYYDAGKLEFENSGICKYLVQNGHLSL